LEELHEKELHNLQNRRSAREESMKIAIFWGTTPYSILDTLKMETLGSSELMEIIDHASRGHTSLIVLSTKSHFTVIKSSKVRSADHIACIGNDEKYIQNLIQIIQRKDIGIDVKLILKYILRMKFQHAD
jgi:hypothetical protein